MSRKRRDHVEKLATTTKYLIKFVQYCYRTSVERTPKEANTFGCLDTELEQKSVMITNYNKYKCDTDIFNKLGRVKTLTTSMLFFRPNIANNKIMFNYIPKYYWTR